MYLLVFKINGKLVLACEETGEISSFSSKEGLLKAFAPFVRKFGADYESAMSATIAMISFIPYGVEYNEPADSLRDWVEDEKIMTYSNIAMHGVRGVTLKENFLEGRQTVDVFHECLQQAGLIQ